jgi:prepilin-type N-terminal cleavage/methylation domain-containing protein/prepilin-type processing-associated H-X9-DG protein
MLHARGSRKNAAFTLVELLVVIGIIAVLISILLPTLSSARRVAQAAKCGAALREIGNAFQMYAMENKGYYPPMRCKTPPYRITFNSVPPIDFVPSNGAQTYWMYFLAKYVSKGKFAPAAGATAQDAAYAMNSVLWGCPNFQPILVNAGDNRAVTTGGVAMVYTGYGYNGFPEYTTTYPPIVPGSLNAIGDTVDPDAVSSVGCSNPPNWSKLNAGRWYKQKQYTRPAERALVGDCRAYVLEAFAATNSAAIAGQADLTSPGTTFWAGPSQGETSYDFYRHGKYPRRIGSIFDTTGGKILYNILYADGHVSGVVTREEGIKSARMRFPG